MIGTGKAIPWHQDSNYWPLIPPGATEVAPKVALNWERKPLQLRILHHSTRFRPRKLLKHMFATAHPAGERLPESRTLVLYFVFALRLFRGRSRHSGSHSMMLTKTMAPCSCLGTSKKRSC